MEGTVAKRLDLSHNTNGYDQLVSGGSSLCWKDLHSDAQRTHVPNVGEVGASLNLIIY